VERIVQNRLNVLAADKEAAVERRLSAQLRAAAAPTPIDDDLAIRQQDKQLTLRAHTIAIFLLLIGHDDSGRLLPTHAQLAELRTMRSEASRSMQRVAASADHVALGQTDTLRGIVGKLDARIAQVQPVVERWAMDNPATGPKGGRRTEQRLRIRLADALLRLGLGRRGVLHALKPLQRVFDWPLIANPDDHEEQRALFAAVNRSR
jgi:hypothetical protein